MSTWTPWELMLLVVPYVWAGMFVTVLLGCGVFAAVRMSTLKVPAGLTLAGLVLVGLESMTVTVWWTAAAMMQLHQTPLGTTLSGIAQFLPHVTTTIAIGLLVAAAVLRTSGSDEGAP